MELGFSSQDAFDRIMSDAHTHYRRVSSNLTFENTIAAEAVVGGYFAAGWLAHGSIQFQRLTYQGLKSVTPSTAVGARRCLVPFGEENTNRLLAAVWTPFKNDVQPHAFHLIRFDDHVIQVGPENWDNWLNPERDVRPMLRRSEGLMVPCH